ncbi:MAG: biotin/lipoyl-containing protein, partial [Pseudomonadota bacterium]
MADITVPVLGESVTEATVGNWLKAAGDSVSKDEVLVELETDKVSVEVSAAEDGVLSEIVAGEGDTVEIGAILGRIGGAGAAKAPTAVSEVPAAAPAAEPSGGGESVDVAVPAMGESVTEGTLSSWLKQPGDAIAQDDPLAEIETDKVAIEVPAPTAGVLAETLISEGTTVEIGTVIARISAGAGAAAAPAPVAQPAAAPAVAAVAAGSGDRPVSPAVRRVSSEAGVDPSAIPGSGKNGRATKGDALSYISNGSATAAPVAARAPRDLGPREERVKMTRLRQTIAKRLKEAQNTAAMLTTFNDVDL